MKKLFITIAAVAAIATACYRMEAQNEISNVTAEQEQYEYANLDPYIIRQITPNGEGDYDIAYINNGDQFDPDNSPFSADTLHITCHAADFTQWLYDYHRWLDCDLYDNDEALTDTWCIEITPENELYICKQ